LSLRDAIHEDGFAIIPDFFPRADIDRSLEAIA